ncbi:unnamed protein product [Brachionus calyciflorus]|uniref:Polypeptide N-acetylgalactosaminyltransferase n=1 Tax=Brachionus calyciflorus TaxID=104777 RepID=A0A813RXM4_9BILA|nr:unnamed protein product [Brachionus calyciflorus]
MVRLKYSAIAKLFAIFFCVVFILPSFFKLFDSQADFNENENHPRNLDRFKNSNNQDSPNRYGDNPENAAVFKEGIIGNYEPKLEPRSGPGEGGVPVHLQPEEKESADRTVREFGFNMVASDKISLDRRIKDTRPGECKYWHYPEISKLPTASVVIVFVNEGWSTLMRTVHSVLNTSPPELIADIILVDDYSNKEHLKDKLEKYIERFKGKVKLTRTTKREGLVRARVIGAEIATGDVIIVLDAHCECVTNWLPPLLTRIAVNRKILAIPIVDGIKWDTLEHLGYNGDTKTVGIYEWGFLKILAIPIVDKIDWNTLEHREVYPKNSRYEGIFEWGFLYKEKALPAYQENPQTKFSTPYGKTLAVPIVDGIDWNTMEHTDIYGNSLNRGIWEWGFLYKETQVPDKESKMHKQYSEPYWSPTHAGGLLAIDKKWFFELGGYDPGIKIWGGEQYELSFKVWQCGGIVEWVPCSHVAHIYRGPRTESVHPPGGNPHQTSINHMRVAEVWMDEYKEYYYIREPQIRRLDYGDISEQLAIKQKLQCKSFKWFMENIAYDLPKKFPLPPKNKVWGECKNPRHRVCLSEWSIDFGQPLRITSCHGELFRLNVEGELSSGEHCFVSDKNIVKKKFCLNYEGIWNPVGEWQYDNENKTIKSSKEKTCLSTDGSNLTLEPCDNSNLNQKWEWKEIYY